MTATLIIWGTVCFVAVAALYLALALSIWRVRRPRAAPRTGQDLPDALELARLRQQQAAAERLATELASIINSPHAACLPLGTCGNARYALSNWHKVKREGRG